MIDTIQISRPEDDQPTLPMPVGGDEEDDAPETLLLLDHPVPPEEPESPGLGQWVKSGLRAAAGRSLESPAQGPGAWQMLWVVAIVSALLAAAARLEIPGEAQFVFRNWLFSWAPSALLLFGLWFVLQWGRRHAASGASVSAWWLLWTVATLPMAVLGLALSAAGAREWLPGWWVESDELGWGIFGVFWLWLLLAAWRITAAVNHSRWVCVGVLVCVGAVQSADTWLLRTRFWQEVPTAQAEPDTLVLSQEVFETQQSLLAQALQGIRPASPAEGDAPHVFGLVYAPYAQDVFLRESAMVQEVLESRFAAQGRVLRLLNHPTTAGAVPWATTRNLQQSLRALAQAMDLQRDVLVVYLTSHGGADFKLAALNWPLEVPDLTAQELRTQLDSVGIRNRVIAVSACYSGGWVEPLEGDTTLVMTAADKDHTSYGCGSRSELTFFGRAVFDEQLRQKTLSFEDAFRASVPLIAQREVEGKKTDGFSNPQISVGTGIKVVLARLEQALKTPVSAPVPAPASAPASPGTP